jgi:hypothetical protein
VFRLVTSFKFIGGNEVSSEPDCALISPNPLLGSFRVEHPGVDRFGQPYRVSEYRSGEASYNRTSCHEPFLSTPSSRTSFSNLHYEYLERSFGFFREGLDLRQGEKLLVKFSVIAELTIDPSVYFGGCAADLASS